MTETQQVAETTDSPAHRALPDRAAGNPVPWGTVATRAAVSLLALASTLAVLGGIGSLLVFDGTLGDADGDVVAWVADHRVSMLDSATTVVSALSDTWTVIGVVVGASAMLWVAGHRRHAAMVLLAIALEFLTFLAVGALIDRPRPDVETLAAVPSTPSFPSGHSAAAFVISGSLVLAARSLSARTFPRALWGIPIVMSLLVAASRVYEGVHNPVDVVAGLLLGVGAVTAAAYATGVGVRPTAASGHRSVEA